MISIIILEANHSKSRDFLQNRMSTSHITRVHAQEV